MVLRDKILIAAGGFIALTALFIVIGLLASGKPRPEDALESIKDMKKYEVHRNEIIDGEPVTDPVVIEPGAGIIDAKTRNREIIPTAKPLPLLPREPDLTMDQDVLGKPAILKNLYKETNKYYIDNHEKPLQPEHYKGIH
jgi:hypothetical protein